MVYLNVATFLFALLTLGFILLVRKELKLRVDTDYKVIGIGRYYLATIEQEMLALEAKSDKQKAIVDNELEPRLKGLEKCS